MRDFVEWLRENGFEVRSAGINSVVYRDHVFQCRLRDTEEEQPEVREFCEQEMVRQGWQRITYSFTPTGRVSLILTHGEKHPADLDEPGMLQVIGEYFDTKTAAAISAVCALPKGAPDA